MVVPLKYKMEHASIDQSFKSYIRRLKSRNAVLVGSETNTRTYRFTYNAIPTWLKKIIKLDNLDLQEQIKIEKEKRMFTVVSQHKLPIIHSTFVSTINFIEDESKATVVFGNIRIKDIPANLKRLVNKKLVNWIQRDFLRDRKQEETIIEET